MEAVREVHAVPDTESTLKRWASVLLAALRSVKIRTRVRSLRLCETLPLGDKRFLAVVQFNHQRLLIGATSHSISLLQQVEEPAETADELRSLQEDHNADGKD